MHPLKDFIYLYKISIGKVKSPTLKLGGSLLAEL